MFIGVPGYNTNMRACGDEGGKRREKAIYRHREEKGKKAREKERYLAKKDIGT